MNKENNKGKKISSKLENKAKKDLNESQIQGQKNNKISRFSYKINFNKFTKIIALLLILTLIVVGYFSYVRYKIIIKRIENEVTISANQVENVFVDYANISEMLLMHINHQMINNPESFRINSKIAQILTTFNQDTKSINSLGNNFISGAMFYWIDVNKNLIASSSGLVSRVINLSSRDYLEKTQKNPNRLQIGSPVIGALSGQSIIPMALGVNNLEGNFSGSIVLSLKLENFMHKFRNLKERNIEFAIIDENNKIIMSSSEEFFRKNREYYNGNNALENKASQNLSDNILDNIEKHYIENYGKIIHSFSLFNLNGHVIYIKEIENQPYKIITAIRSKNAYKIVSAEMLPTFIELSLIVIFLIMVKIIYSVLIFKNRK
jgi:hypothetical protein